MKGMDILTSDQILRFKDINNRFQTDILANYWSEIQQRDGG